MPTPALIQVPSVSGSVQGNVDGNQLTTSAGSVQRQVITPGDATNASNYQVFDAGGNAQIKFGPAPASLLTPVVINGTGSTIQICAGSSGKTVRLYRLLLMVGAATNLTFQDGSTPLSGALPCLANALLTLDLSGDPWYTSSPGNPLNIANSADVQVSGTAWYVQS
jgi:hypothetical protein